MADFVAPSGPPPPKVPEGWKAQWNEQYKEWYAQLTSGYPLSQLASTTSLVQPRDRPNTDFIGFM